MNMSDAGTGVGSSTSPTSQTSTNTIIPSPTNISTAGPARRRHKQILKCTQCRLDKQRCTPVERIWPNRCDRCVKYNHSCSPGLNAREERRRQAPSSFPLSVRTPPPQSETKSRSETLSPAPCGQYGTNVAYMMRVPSPGTASSTAGSDDDQGDYCGGYNGGIQGGSRSGVSGYQGECTSRIGQSQNLCGLTISNGHLGVAKGSGSADAGKDITSYLNCLIQPSCDIPSPSISNPTTPIYPFQSSSNQTGYPNYSYFPLDACQPHPSSRPRSPISRTLHARFTQFWAHINPLGIVCSNSPKFSNTVHTIFTHYVPIYAETDDMVNHALMAFSAADAGINAGGEWGRKLNIAGWKHAGECQRMLGVRVGKLKLGPTEQSALSVGLVAESEITAVRLSIFLMLCYGLCINDASLLSLTSQLLAMSKTIPGHPTSSNSPTTIPITSTYSDLPDGGYRVRLSLDQSRDREETEEVGLIVGHDTQIFSQIRKEYESQLAPEIVWEAFNEDDDDNEAGEEEEEEADDDVSGRREGSQAGNGDDPLAGRLCTKRQPDMLRLTSTPTTLRMSMAQPGTIPTSATTLTPNVAVLHFSELHSASYPSPTGGYRMDLSANHSHVQPHTHQLPGLAGQSSNSSSPQVLEGARYSQAPPHMYVPEAPLRSYAATGAISPPVPLPPQLPTDNIESKIGRLQRHMHPNMDI